MMYNAPGRDLENEYIRGDMHFLEALFDMSFSEFVTVQLVRILYVLMLILGVIISVTVVISLFSRGLLFGLFSVLLAPMAFMLWTISARVGLEMVVVVFRIADYLREMTKTE